MNQNSETSKLLSGGQKDLGAHATWATEFLLLLVSIPPSVIHLSRNSMYQMSPGDNAQGWISSWFPHDNQQTNSEAPHRAAHPCAPSWGMETTPSCFLSDQDQAIFVLTNTKWKLLCADGFVCVRCVCIHFIHWVLTTTLWNRLFSSLILHWRI